MSARPSKYENWGIPERIAVWAAGTGFGVSALMMMAYRVNANSDWPGFNLRGVFESAFVFLWPSALLLKGAQTAQGGVILFLFSAALNAGYYVFVSLAAYLLYGKLETIFTAVTPANMAPLRVYSAPKLLRRS